MELSTQLQHHLDNKTKPPGSLGMLEAIAVQAGCIWQTLTPAMVNPHIIVFAGDHGIAATGLVNPYPQAVTAQMVLNFVQGGAAINVLCRQHGITLQVADAGVNYNFDSSLPLHHIKVGYGTRNYLQGPAMTLTEVQQAIQHGRQLVTGVSQTGCNTIGFGEMGIGNSSSAALLMHHYTGLPLQACTGAGTGAANERYHTKLATLQQVAGLHLDQQESLPAEEVLARVGGYELAMMCGAYLAAADHHMLVLVDGFIATAALLCARQINPAVTANCLFAHQSGEKGHTAMLQYLQATPLLQLAMRLGEGTGSAMAVPLVKSALALYAEMATFEAAAVSKSQ